MLKLPFKPKRERRFLQTPKGVGFRAVKRMKENLSTDNIFADLGLKNAEELRARSDLMSEVVIIIRNSGLSQKEIAEILKISAPKVSALMTGKINDFSNDTLVHYLTLLGCNVEGNAQHRISRSMKRGRVNVKRPITRRRRTKTRV